MPDIKCDIIIRVWNERGLTDRCIENIEKNAEGIYHGAGAEFIDRYDYVNKIADVFELDKALIQRVKLKDLKLLAYA